MRISRPLFLLAVSATTTPASLLAQTAGPSTTAPATPAPDDNEIIVTAQRPRGEVVSDFPPVVELDAQAVESYGATSITDLLSALAPQTGPGRGRGGGGPVVLVNGQRISGFQELRDLPPEAIQKVQILPEEVALQYGYSADQRVVNFILKDDFRSLVVEAEGGGSTAGERTETQLQSTLVTIGKKGRLSLTGEYDNNTRVLESDHGIIEQNQAGNPGDYRTLLPASDMLRVNGVFNRNLTDTVSATFNGSWQRDNSQALLGRPAATLIIPAGKSFSPVAAPLTDIFYFDPALLRESTTDALHGGLTVNGNLIKWTWTLTANYDRTTVRTATDRGVNATLLQADVTDPNGTLNPFAPSPGTLPLLPRDDSRSQTDTSNGIYTISGPLLNLPAGAVRATVRGGFATTRLASTALRNGGQVATRLARNEANGRVNVEIPLANADRDVAPVLGKLSINGNLAYRRLSDFGGLTSFGYGLNWQPVAGLTILASAIGADNEPAIGDLGNPVIITGAVPTYDFARGETVLATRISGGNPALVTEVQRDQKFSVDYQPTKLKGLTLGIDYFRNRSRNPVASFPILTPDIEAAFPGRVVRDPTGRLVSIDQRSVNFAEARSDVVRVGFTFQKEFGQPAGGRGAGIPGISGGPRPDAAGAPRAGAGGFGRGGGGFGRNNDQGGRWTIALYDSIRFRDEILIRPGLPVLDLLGGNATGSSGGAARHSFDLDTGWFNKGFGVRLTGSYQSGSTVIGSTTASTLEFGSLATINASVFMNFDSRKKLVQTIPFLKGARLRLQVQNLTNAVRDVRDGTGTVPLGYQPGYLDARGRFINIEFRKRF